MKCAECGKDYPSKYYFSLPSICKTCFQKRQTHFSGAKPMQCPECKSQMTEQCRSGITIDECDKCRSIWFDADELEAYSKVSGKVLESTAELISQFVPRSDSPDLTCPRCLSGSIKSGSTDELRLAYCTKCSGMFLRKEEIQKIAGQKKASKGLLFGGAVEVIVDILSEFFD